MKMKMFAIFALLIFVTGIGAVSAFDLGSIFGNDDQQNETVTIDGIDFNIPSGYVEDPTNTTASAASALEGFGLDLTVKGYLKGTTGVAIMVDNDTSNNGVSNQQIFSMIGGNETKINNVDGYLRSDGIFSLFSFEKDNHIVVISSTDEKAIADFLIA